MLTPDSGFPKFVLDSRLRDCVDTLLSMQNKDGGFGSYELVRGGAWLEVLNPAEIFDRIVVEYSYPECTTSVLNALSLLHFHFPNHKSAEIKSAVSSAAWAVALMSARYPDKKAIIKGLEVSLDFRDNLPSSLPFFSTLLMRFWAR